MRAVAVLLERRGLALLRRDGCDHSVRRVGGPQGPLLLQQQGRVGDDELPHLRPGVDLEWGVPRPRPIPPSALTDRR